MRVMKWAFALGFAAALAATSAFAGDRGTPEEAKALLEKGVAHFKDVGPDKAMADFNDPKGAYWDRDLWIFVYGDGGKAVCVPGIPALVGRDQSKAKDVDGKEYGKAIIDAADKGGGWTDYRMTNPVTKKVEPKRSYSMRVGEYVLGAGAYSSPASDQ